MSIKVSIITVAYNSAETIADTLDSVAFQTHTDFEHIVVDGGSKDGSIEIVNSYKRQGVILFSEPDDGIYDAMNKGLRVASGDVIGFLNADDRYAHANILAKVVREFENENVEAVFGDVEFFNPEKGFNCPIRRYSSSHFKPERIAWGWMPAHPTLFLKSNLYQQFGGYKTDYKIAGDFELIARIFSSAAVNYRYLPEVLVQMRIGGVSTGGWKNTILLNKEVIRACRENGISTNIVKLLSKYPLKIMEFIKK